MKFSGNKKLLLAAIILLAAFLLNIAGYRLLPSAALAFITATVIYAAVFACLLIVTKEHLSPAGVLIALGVTVLFFAVDRCLTLLSVSLIAALIYQIIRPVIAAALIVFAGRLIMKTKIGFNPKIAIAAGVAFLLHAAVSVLSYFSLAESAGFAAAVFLGNIYSLLVSFLTYAIIFIAFCAVTSQISGEKAVTGGQSDAENV